MYIYSTEQINKLKRITKNSTNNVLIQTNNYLPVAEGLLLIAEFILIRC